MLHYVSKCMEILTCPNNNNNKPNNIKKVYMCVPEEVLQNLQ
jgi:hypothetical protein